MSKGTVPVIVGPAAVLAAVGMLPGPAEGWQQCGPWQPDGDSSGCVDRCHASFNYTRECQECSYLEGRTEYVCGDPTTESQSGEPDCVPACGDWECCECGGGSSTDCGCPDEDYCECHDDYEECCVDWDMCSC